MRLDKYVMNAMQISRSDAKKVIKGKKIYVNDKIINMFDYNVLENDKVFFDNGSSRKELDFSENIYLMMNKPTGYVCAKSDKMQKVVMDLIDDFDVSKLSIVGRLDIDSEGLLLITTDGKLLHELTSPKKDCPKKYYVEVNGTFTQSDIKAFFEGIEILIDGEIYRCKKSILEIVNEKCAYITIYEGKFHQVKKMCFALGKEVVYLKRVMIASLSLDESLKTGEYRKLTETEIELLKK